MKLLKTKLSPEIETALSHVIDEIETNPHVQMFKLLTKNIDEDEQLKHLWSEKKRIQQELIQAKQYQLFEQQKYLTLQLNAVDYELENHPLINIYNDVYVKIADIQKEIEEIVFNEK